MDYTLVNTGEGIKDALLYLQNATADGLDIETTSLAPRDGEISLIQLSDGVKIFVIDCIELDGRYSRDAIYKLSVDEKEKFWEDYVQAESLKLLIPFLEAEKPRKVVQNLKFEATWFQEKLGCEINGGFDTYLAGKLLDMPADAKLDALLERYLGVTVSKEEQKSDWSGKLTKEQLEYAARDAFHLPALREKQIYYLRQADMIEVAAIEFNAVKAVAKMEAVGFPIDLKMYRELVDELVIRRDVRAKELEEVLNDAMGYVVTTTVQGDLWGEDAVITTGGVNLNSPKQVTEAFKRLGVDLPSTSKQTITNMVGKNPQLKYLTDYRAEQILVTAFGEKIINIVNAYTGRIHASFWQLKPATGRFAASNPNLQQMPHTDEFRQCFRPSDPDRVFVIADYSGIELRILAQISQDPVMIDAFNNNRDLHSITAIAAFGLNCTEDEVKTLHKEFRAKAKGLNFGVVYGIGANKYADNVGITPAMAKKAIRGFYDTYKGVERYLYDIEDYGIKNRHVRTLADRKLQLYFDPTNDKEISMARRNARNYPIQGTSADILKLALGLLYPRLAQFKDAYIVNIVHDEIIVECNRKDGEDVKRVLSESMLEAAYKYLPDIFVEAEAEIAESWADKK